MASSSAIPDFAPTALDDITAKVGLVRRTYRTNKTKDIRFRQQQIRRLYWGVVDNAALIEEGLQRDMGKSRFEAHLTEMDWVKNEAINVANKLDRWARDESVADLPLTFLPMHPRIRNEPLGTVLIIGAFNYPYQLNLTPLIGAIAAGNCVVLKPSELAPHSAMVIKKIMDEYLDPDCYVCVNGALDETKHVLEHKFDKIMFTGGKKTGAIIATKAASTLTPVLLELGGQNPAFVTRHGNVKLAARRLLWQKCLNAGQICLSHNYVLIDRRLVDEFISEINKQYRIFMPGGARDSDMSRIVNRGHFDRLMKMLTSSRGKVVMGGASDAEKLWIEPTAVLVDSIDDSMMAEETFGPIWSIMPFDTLDEAIDLANRVDPTPLALFTFGSDEENKKGKLPSRRTYGRTTTLARRSIRLPPSPARRPAGLRRTDSVLYLPADTAFLAQQSSTTSPRAEPPSTTASSTPPSTTRRLGASGAPARATTTATTPSRPSATSASSRRCRAGPRWCSACATCRTRTRSWAASAS